MNSREKGKRGERQWRDELRANGYTARRGQQFCGSADSPDVISDELKWAHMEVKCVERFNIYEAMDQAARDAGSVAPTGHLKVPFVMHKRNFRRWLVAMDAETFFKFLTGELPPGELRSQESEFRSHLTPALSPKGGEGDSAQGECSGESPERTGGGPVPPKTISDVAGESPDTAGALSASTGNTEQTKQTEH